MILCLCVCIFSFVCIFGIFLNIVGADLVVHVEPDKIDSLNDLLGHTIQPYIVKNLYLFNLLKASPKSSKLHQLWLRTGAVNRGIFDFDPDDQQGTFLKAMDLVDQIDNSTVALIVPNFTFDPAPKSLACLYFKQLENVTQANELFAPGIIASLMSSKIHPYVEKVYRYIMTTIFETQLFSGALKDVLLESDRMTGSAMRVGSRELRCGERTDDRGPRPPVFLAFTLNDMQTLFKFYFLLTFSAFFPYVFSIIGYELYIQQKADRTKEKYSG